MSFGPVGDRASMPRMLLFNVDTAAIRPCSPQAVKRHRRDKRHGRASPASPAPSSSPFPVSEQARSQILAAADPASPTFVHAVSCPLWQDFDLDAKIFAVHTLKFQQNLVGGVDGGGVDESGAGGDDVPRHAQFAALVEEHAVLLARHKALVACSAVWHWPVAVGREVTTAKTPVPDVNQSYALPQPASSETGHARIALAAILQSFLRWNSNEVGASKGYVKPDPVTDSLKRLPAFRQLAMGKVFRSVAGAVWDTVGLSPLFDPATEAEWQTVLAHYSSNASTLFEDGGPPQSQVSRWR